MEPTDSADLITYSDLKQHLLSYESHVPPKIQGLESFRLKEIPVTLMRRYLDGGAFLEKEEVTKLVEWKLWVTLITKIYRTPAILTFYVLQ